MNQKDLDKLRNLCIEANIEQMNQNFDRLLSVIQELERFTKQKGIPLPEEIRLQKELIQRKIGKE